MSADAELRSGLKVQLRDGVELSATAYLPGPQSLPAPAVLTMSPYGSDVYHALGTYFAGQGLPFVVVDVRGRGDSKGRFRPRIQEANDGYDVVEWLAREPYCDGRVAMRGASYCGYAQWATAKEFPPHLATIVPTAAPCPGLDVPFRHNIFAPYAIQWLALLGRASANFRLFSDRPIWAAAFRRWHESGRRFRDLDAFVGMPSPIFQKWLDHPEPGAYWDAHNPTSEQYGRLSLPILTITGMYDGNQPGALEHYKNHLRNAAPEACARHYLVIGPWDHAGTSTPKAEFGGLRIGEAGMLDLARLHFEWYDWVLRGGTRPAFLANKVAYYVTGSEVWRFADSIEAVTARSECWFLDSSGEAGDVYASGTLALSLASGSPDSFAYDPCDVDGPGVAAEAKADAASLLDQSVVLAMGGRQLVYHTPPFKDDEEICGFFKLSAWISIDCPDTDLFATVYEIGLDGGSVRLSADAIRARYRESLRRPKLIRTTNPLRYDFNHFTFAARRVRRGHRLRLVIAPTGRLIDEPFIEKNYNAGGVVADESVEDARKVTVRLFHDADHPSALYVPIGRAA